MFVWKKEDPSGAIEWASKDSAMVPLISCKADMSSWLRAKYLGSGASGIRGRPGEMTSDRVTVINCLKFITTGVTRYSSIDRVRKSLKFLKKYKNLQTMAGTNGKKVRIFLISATSLAEV